MQELSCSEEVLYAMQACRKALTSILILDDNEVTRGTISKLVGFRLPEIQLYTAVSCRAGVRLCKRHNIDMVIAESGIHQRRYQYIVSKIRRINRRTKILLITTDSEPGKLVSTSHRLDVSLVQMPVDFEELLKVTMTAISRIEEERQLSPAL
jgi:DNA-binding NtrC family response regulator